MKNSILIFRIMWLIMVVGCTNLYGVNSGKVNHEVVQQKNTKKEKRSFVKAMKKKIKAMLKMKKSTKDKTDGTEIVISVFEILGNIILTAGICVLILFLLLAAFTVFPF